MLADFLQFITKLIEVGERMSSSSKVDRQRIATYFQQVSQCMLEIAEGVKKGNSRAEKWGELEEYAASLPISTRKAIGLEKENEISLLLERMIRNPPANSDDAKELEIASGRLLALANRILTDSDKGHQNVIRVSDNRPIVISRRGILFAGITSATLAGAAIYYNKPVKWKMVSFLNQSLKDKVRLYEVPLMVAKRVGEMTNGRFIIEVDTTGKIQTEAILERVKSDEIQCGFSGIYYEDPMYRPLFFGCAIPFGLTQQEQTAWLSYKKNPNDKYTYMQTLYQTLVKGVIPFPAGATGGQMGGWFKSKLSSPSQLQGLKMRIPGLGADVLAELGVKSDKAVFGSPIAIDQISSRLENGDIDAAEWIGPHDDFMLNLHKTGAKYYYYPGWWEPSTTFDMQVNEGSWNSLPLEYQSVFEAACHETYQKILSDYDRLNSLYLEKIRSRKDIEILPFPSAILQKAEAETSKVLRTYDSNADFREVHKDWLLFKSRIRPWTDLTSINRVHTPQS
jgi:TRAP-type mannitol/chloroaromatic compound transport system substrate-binding protein